VLTPVPTPSSSATLSIAQQHVSLPSTPELSQASDHIHPEPPAQPVLPPAAEPARSITDDEAADDDDFPSYSG